ncbi:ficolin-2-like [Nematostella vectensis]|uniref:ficolin-2-like n=1 Tax=Nematostella vectensis TaxID=45351 RepID=UPI002077918D|nr:ficolin-2-like [Nematostella vectensis]
MKDRVDGKYLKRHNESTFTGETEAGCIVKCLFYSPNHYCQSVNYFPATQTCLTSTSTHHQHPEDLVYEAGSVYLGTKNDCVVGSCPSNRMCKADFVNEGFSCVFLFTPDKPCFSSPCSNGSICNNTQDGKNYTCTCLPGHTGRHCERVNENCATILSRGSNTSGVYTVDPDGKGAFQVFCDQETSGGGWTVFQRREDGSVDFYRNWTEYKHGFGDLQGEFWLGLEKIYRLTNVTINELRVDLGDAEGSKTYAQYGYFATAAESDKYRISVASYFGTAGDSFVEWHNNAAFSTQDKDNDQNGDENCAAKFKGAWWFTDCFSSHLNGKYLNDSTSYGEGIIWSEWKGHYLSLKRTEMKIKPRG